MSVVVKNPDTLFMQMAYDLYNGTKSTELPKASGNFGVDDTVWAALISLTKAKCKAKSIPLPGGDHMTGLCIWASVVATKFCVIRNHMLDSHLVRVIKTGEGKGSDHYFVVADQAGTKLICDITCSQFTGAPDYLVGRLSDVRGTARKIIAMGGTLHDAYTAGAMSGTYVL